MHSRDVLARLEKAGGRHVRQRGSCIQLMKDGAAAVVTVPHPKKELRIGPLRSIERAGGVKLTEW